MSRFLFISHRADRSGAPVLLRNLLQLLKENTGFTFRVLIKEDGAMREEFQALAPTSVLVRQRRSFLHRIYSYFIKFRLRLQMPHSDIVLSNTISNGNIHRIIGRHPCIFTYVHELPFVIEKITGAKELGRVLSHSRLFLVPSNAVSHHLQTTYAVRPQQIKRLPYYVPDKLPEKAKWRAQFRERNTFDTKTFVVGGMGTAGFRKGTDLFLETARCVVAIDPSVHFVWCGGDPDSYDWKLFASAIEKENLKSHVSLFAELEHPMTVMAGFDLFFLSSREDPYPLVMLEAAMMNIPVVYFAGSGGADEFVSSECGLGAEAFSTNGACDNIVRLRNDAGVRENKAAKAREKYFRLHTAEPVLKAFHTVLEETGVHQHPGN